MFSGSEFKAYYENSSLGYGSVLSDGTVSVTPGIINTEMRENLIRKLMLFFTGNTRDLREILSGQPNYICRLRERVSWIFLNK